mgnify:CR=1 FL=1
MPSWIGCGLITDRTAVRAFFADRLSGQERLRVRDSCREGGVALDS